MSPAASSDRRPSGSAGAKALTVGGYLGTFTADRTVAVGFAPSDGDSVALRRVAIYPGEAVAANAFDYWTLEIGTLTGETMAVLASFSTAGGLPVGGLMFSLPTGKTVRAGRLLGIRARKFGSPGNLTHVSFALDYAVSPGR